MNEIEMITELNLQAVMKPQYVDQIPRVIKGEVGALMKKKDERKVRDELITDLCTPSLLILLLYITYHTTLHHATSHTTEDPHSALNGFEAHCLLNRSGTGADASGGSALRW